MKTKTRKLFLTLAACLALVCLALFAVTACSGGEVPSGEKTLVSIALETPPAKLEYEIGDTVDTAGMKVVATFSDGTTEDVTKDCTTSIGSDEITATTTSYYVKYVYNKVTKTVRVDIKVNKIELEMSDYTAEEFAALKAPWKIAEESTADYVFITSFDSGTMQVDGVLELTGTEANGTYVYTERNDKPTDVDEKGERLQKYASLSGTYTTVDGVMTLRASAIKHNHTTRLDSATVDTAEVVHDEDGSLIGLYMGSMFKSEGTVFGWGKSSASAFVASLATKYGHEAKDCYFEIVKDGTVPGDVDLYHVAVASIEIEHAPEKAEYEYGEFLVMTGLKIKVNYEAGAPRIIETGYDYDKKDALVDTDTTVTVTYEGKEATFTITVGAAPETGLVSIAVEGIPDDYGVQYGTTLNAILEGFELTVTATYADDGRTGTVTDYTVVDGDEVITALPETVTLSYTEDDVTKTAAVSVGWHWVTPYELAQRSKADYVFYTWFTKDKNQLNGTLELTGSETEGTFVYTAQMGADKYNIVSGNYAVTESTIDFTETTLVNVMGSSSMVTGDAETATVCKNDAGEIVGLDFGLMSGSSPDKFWGYSASKASSFKEGAGEKAENAGADRGYMIRITQETLFEDLTKYY